MTGGSGSEAKKKKKKGLLCPDYAEVASKKEIRGLQVAATTSKSTAASILGPTLVGSRPKHKKGKNNK